MPDPTRSLTLEAWADARPLDRKIVGVRMAGRWVVALVDETGEPVVGSGRSLHDAIEAAQDEQDSAARRAGSPPRPALRAAVCPCGIYPACGRREQCETCRESMVDDSEPLLSSEEDARAVEGSEVPELCSCGHDWTWELGAYVGVQDDTVDQIELRNCPWCGSTRARVLPTRAA